MKQHTIKVFPKTADVTLLRFLSPEGKLIGERELDPFEVNRFVTEVERKYRVVSIDSTTMVLLGRELYEWLDGPAHRWLSGALNNSGGMTLRIDVDGRLRHLPWELLYTGGAYLCSNDQQPFTPARLVTGRQQQIERHNRPLRLLFMACSAEDVNPLLDFESEERMILQSAQRYQIDLSVEESGSLGGLQYQIDAFGTGYFDIFHLTGHADVRGDRPCFLMEGNQGFRQEVSAEDLTAVFQGRWPRLIFLSGCNTGQAPDQGHLPSLCEALVRAGAPAVLGWALPVGDASASLAAAELYGHLAVGKPIDEAVARARLHLLKEQSGYWNLLRLYVNDTPFDGMVTSPKTPKRARLQVREAANVFLDAGAKVEVCKRELFIGRRRPIQRCLRTLQSREGDEHYAEGVLLHGMGGLGKSSLAARLCERLPGHKRIVFVGALDELGFTGKISNTLTDPEAIRLLNQAGLNLTQRLRNLLAGPLSAHPTLFALDDFEQNLEASGGGYVAKSVPLEILKSLLTAIRETSSESRVIITSRYKFPLPSPLKLMEEGLESLRGGELEKKLTRLKAFDPSSSIEEKTRERARALGAGNPRLLEWLDKVLVDAETDANPIMGAMEAEADRFRESVLLRDLLAQLPRECRRMMALASVYELPFDKQALAAAVDGPLDPHLTRAVSLGLIEAGTDPATGQLRYFISRIMLPIVELEITIDEKVEASRRAARYRQQTFRQSGGAGLPEMIEVFNLAIAAREQKIAVEVGELISRDLISRSRYREVKLLCQTALILAGDYRLLFHLARAQGVLGETTESIRNYDLALSLCPDSDLPFKGGILLNLATMVAQQGDFTRAMDLRRQSLEFYEQSGDLQGKASALHEMALVAAQQGDVTGAVDLWQQSLAISKQTGNVLGQAATLSCLADMAAQRGDIRGAFELWLEALSLFEQIGDAQRQATTLHNIGLVLAQEGDVKGAFNRWHLSIQLKEQTGDVKGKAATLVQMADLMGEQGEAERANELWQEAIQLFERIGDVHGKAATLAQMAWHAWQRGEFEAARRLNLEAAKSFVILRAWLDLTTVLGNLGISPLDGALRFLAQAIWLAVRVEFPVEDAFKLINEMLVKLGVEHNAAPQLGAAAVHIAQKRGQHHSEYEKLFRQATNMLAACAAARKVGPDQFEQWIVSEGLNDPNRFLPVISLTLESMVSEEEWLFDRRLVGAN